VWAVAVFVTRSSQARPHQMSNPEHLAEIRKGVKAWNQWREQHPEIMPDLSRANLKDLRATHLHLANRGADLSEAMLTRATLVPADLKRASAGQALSWRNSLGRTSERTEGRTLGEQLWFRLTSSVQT
jgi:hypothetical protein